MHLALLGIFLYCIIGFKYMSFLLTPLEYGTVEHEIYVASFVLVDIFSLLFLKTYLNVWG